MSAGCRFDQILQDSKAGGGGDEKWLAIEDDMDMRSYLGLTCCIYTNLQPGSELGSAIMHMVGYSPSPLSSAADIMACIVSTVDVH